MFDFDDIETVSPGPVSKSAATKAFSFDPPSRTSSKDTTQKVLGVMGTRNMASANWSHTSVKFTVDKCVATLVLQSSTIDDHFIDACLDALVELHNSIGKVRLVVVKGSPQTFSDGINSTVGTVDNLKAAYMFYLFSQLPQYVVGLVQGSCIGAGVGLISTFDYLICLGVPSTSFVFTACRYSPIYQKYTVSKIGVARARMAILTCKQATAAEAKEMGLVQVVAKDKAEMETFLKKVVQNANGTAPGAVAGAKEYLTTLASEAPTVESISEAISKTESYQPLEPSMKLKAVAPSNASNQIKPTNEAPVGINLDIQKLQEVKALAKKHDGSKRDREIFLHSLDQALEKDLSWLKNGKAPSKDNLTAWALALVKIVEELENSNPSVADGEPRLSMMVWMRLYQMSFTLDLDRVEARNHTTSGPANGVVVVLGNAGGFLDPLLEVGLTYQKKGLDVVCTCNCAFKTWQERQQDAVLSAVAKSFKDQLSNGRRPHLVVHLLCNNGYHFWIRFLALWRRKQGAFANLPSPDEAIKGIIVDCVDMQEYVCMPGDNDYDPKGGKVQFSGPEKLKTPLWGAKKTYFAAGLKNVADVNIYGNIVNRLDEDTVDEVWDFDHPIRAIVPVVIKAVESGKLPPPEDGNGMLSKEDLMLGFGGEPPDIPRIVFVAKNDIICPEAGCLRLAKWFQFAYGGPEVPTHILKGQHTRLYAKDGSPDQYFQLLEAHIDKALSQLSGNGTPKFPNEGSITEQSLNLDCKKVQEVIALAKKHESSDAQKQVFTKALDLALERDLSWTLHQIKATSDDMYKSWLITLVKTIEALDNSNRAKVEGEVTLGMLVWMRLYQLSWTLDGDRVDVQKSIGDGKEKGCVLILGNAGGFLKNFNEVCESYQKKGYGTICTCHCGFKNWQERQYDFVVEALVKKLNDQDGKPRVVVHMLCNNGYHFWIQFLSKWRGNHGKFAGMPSPEDVLKAVIVDCIDMREYVCLPGDSDFVEGGEKVQFCPPDRLMKPVWNNKTYYALALKVVGDVNIYGNLSQRIDDEDFVDDVWDFDHPIRSILPSVIKAVETGKMPLPEDGAGRLPLETLKTGLVGEPSEIKRLFFIAKNDIICPEEGCHRLAKWLTNVYGGWGSEIKPIALKGQHSRLYAKDGSPEEYYAAISNLLDEIDKADKNWWPF